MLAYDHTMTQVKNNTDVLYEKLQLKSLYGLLKQKYLQFYAVNCMSVPNYIKNNWSPYLQNLTWKGIVMFFNSVTWILSKPSNRILPPVVLWFSLTAKFVTKYSNYNTCRCILCHPLTMMLNVHIALQFVNFNNRKHCSQSYYGWLSKIRM